MTRVGIARIPREYTDMVLATLFFMNKIGKQTCSFRILHVSGKKMSRNVSGKRKTHFQDVLQELSSRCKIRQSSEIAIFIWRNGPKQKREVCSP